MKALRIVALIIAILFLIVIARLAVLDHGGPPHESMTLPGEIPATMYLPSGDTFYRMFAPPQPQRPPAVVLVHGFMSDRHMMSVLARRIAQNGYAVLTIDVSGHGENQNPFGNDLTDGLRGDIAAAVNYLRSYELVDGTRIVVMGHSMGAGAALDYATHDPNLSGSVMISGGWQPGPERPKDALFIFAQHDPRDAIQDTSTEIAAHLAGVSHIELGKVYGDPKQGTAVEAVRIPDVNHIQIVYSPVAAATIIKWLDGAFGTARAGSINLKDPRIIWSEVAVLLFLILLVPIGRICGAIAGEWISVPPGFNGWIGIAIVAGALVAAWPLVAMIQPAAFISFVVGDVQTSWLAVAGVILIVALIMGRVLIWERMRDSAGATLLGAAIAFAIVYACLGASTGVTFHGLSLTPERLTMGTMAAILAFPFWLGFEFMVRRGSVTISTTRAVIGRIVILVLMGVGAAIGILSSVVFLILPSLALLFVMIEIFSASAYSVSRNLWLIAIVETAWFAWAMAATNPITFMF